MKVLMMLICIVFMLISSNQAELVNEDVSRVIDLRSHLVKVTTTVTLKNDKSGPVSTFRYNLDPSHVKQLAYIAFSKSAEESKPYKMVESDPENKVYVVTLPSKLDSEATTTFVVVEVYAQAVTPFPKEITQSQNQLVVYRGNHFYYSPYLTESQVTTVELPSNTVESYTKALGPDKEGSTIKYGDTKDFENVAALSQNAMKIHYESNSPFLTVTKLTRVIEVSHWGNIAVEEHIDLRHTGAKLKGSFSRYDYQRIPNSGASSVKSFKTILPAAASDVYYRDEIGNISTSNLYQTDDSVDFEIRPRFPLFGGWKTYYYIGYNLRSYNYLYSRGDLHALKMRFVDHVMDDQLVEDLTVKVILPEGAKNIKVKTPYPVNRSPDELHFTYLDTVGRPVVIMKKNSLLEQHIDDFVLSYNFNRLLLLQEPLLVVGAFFLLFFTVIIVVRLDFSIAYDGAVDTKMRINGIIEQVQQQQASRNAYYNSYEEAVAKYKTSKDAAAFQSTRKNIDKNHKDASQAINRLIGKIREDSSEAADKDNVIVSRSMQKIVENMQVKQSNKAHSKKEPFSLRSIKAMSGSGFDLIKRSCFMVSNLNQLDSSMKEKLNNRVNLAEKLVNKKLTREQYNEQDGKIQKSIEHLSDQISELVDNLTL